MTAHCGKTGHASLNRFFDFTAAINPLGPSRKVKQVLRKSIKTLGTFPDNGIRFLKTYVSRQEAIPEESIIFGHGSTFLLHMLIHMLTPERVLVVTPLSRKRAEIFEQTSSTLSAFPLSQENGYLFDTKKFLTAFSTADLIYLSNPHDITGALIPPEEMEYVIEASEKENKRLIIDEAYGEFVGMESPVSRVVASRNAFIIRTFSTFHGLPGLRAGYIIGPPQHIEIMNTCIIPPRLHTLAYKGAIVSLKDEGFRRRTKEFIETEKAYMIRKLSHIGGVKVFNTPCNFLLLTVDKQYGSLHEKLFNKCILTEEYDGGEGTYLMRVPIKLHKANARFVKALKSIFEDQ